MTADPRRKKQRDKACRVTTPIPPQKKAAKPDHHQKRFENRAKKTGNGMAIYSFFTMSVNIVNEKEE
jgi:hypothetical protein